jgi:hypothetical protein
MRDYPRLVRASRVAVLVGRLLSFAKKSTDDGDGGGEEAASKKRERVLSLFFPTAQASKIFVLVFLFPSRKKARAFFFLSFSLKSNTA